MTNPYKTFGTNKELESGKGVTLQYEGFSITIHRAGGSNKKFAHVLSSKLKPHRQKLERGQLDEETSQRLLIEAYAESVVIGWKNVTDEKGKKLAFSVENAIKLFTDLPDLFDDVKSQANSAAIFREEAEELEAKN